MTAAILKVTERALLARVNRKLAQESAPMRMCVLSERSRWFSDLGRYYVIDLHQNVVDCPHTNIKDWARRLGVLGASEVMT